ncbi:293_t:CDS:2 [Gigaspora margarita]|uniref:DNA 3'-5' helicase n=1 Tax=Gigaspora margarita TaxID=4874 RepID=A0ABN7VTD4_GIGMA|nr:293_t:CDS:2 [Gigaspora margarita]
MYNYKIRTNGLSVKITLKCRTCNTSIVHSNESPKVDFSKAIARAGLVGDSYVRNAPQRSGEFIYNENLEAKNHQTLPLTDKELQEMQTKGVVQYLQNNHSNCWNSVCWHIENPDLILKESNLKMVFKNECDELVKFLTQIIKLPLGQSLITTIHTSQNEAINQVLKITCQASNFQEFSEQDLINIEKIHKQREEKCQVNINQIKQHNQKPYQFKLSFADLIPNWATFIKCEKCYLFPKKFPNRLCILCGFYFNNNLLSQIPNELYHSNLGEALLDKSSSIKTNLLNTILSEVFGFQNYCDQQKESIESFLFQKDTLSIMKTDSGKTLIYAVASILFEGLTVIFSSLKSLMENQLLDLKSLEIVLEVIPKPSKLEKLLEKICKSLDTITSARIIIYSATVAHCNKIATYLASRYSISIIGKYHGSLDDITKNVNLNRWKNGSVKIMCATNAFGMGINVADIQLVIHTTFSILLNNFVQEIGQQVIDSSIERQQQYLAERTHKILEMVTICENDYQY